MNTITYKVGTGLYLNITNKCSMDCVFCIRRNMKGVGDAESLWLDSDPPIEDILGAISQRNLFDYSEIVFCGYGEPTARLADLLFICRWLKKDPEVPKIRLNTNGHASMIAGRDVAPEFYGLIDAVSISLNAATAENYVRLCRPKQGPEAYDAMLEFASRIKIYVPDTSFSVVDLIGEREIESCRKIADSIGIPLRVRAEQ